MGKSALFSRLQRLVPVEGHEWIALVWSFLYFFSLLCGYYVLRPVRDEMGIQGGVEVMHVSFTIVFLVMLLLVPLYGVLVARFSRARLLPFVYGFFILNLLLFYWLFDHFPHNANVARGFFVWVSVFNLFVVSVFWSFMSDIFANRDARRLFGLIAAGGSAGAIMGPLLTVQFVKPLGVVNLLLVSAGFLSIALVCVFMLSRWVKHHDSKNLDDARRHGAAIGGGLWSGLTNVLRSPYLLGVAAYVFLLTTLATFVYFTQAHLVRDAFSDPAQRTQVFAYIDLATNILTILLQIFVTGHLLSRIGVGFGLIIMPLLLGIGFIGLGLSPVLWILLAVQVIRRAGNYSISRPAREVLFTVVSREDRYKSKTFIDTVMYRGGDAASAWVYAFLGWVGFGISGIAWIAVVVVGLWLALGYWLGYRHDQLNSLVKTGAGPH